MGPAAQLVALTDGADRPLALGFASGATAMTLGPQSTALALVTLLPGMGETDPDSLALLSFVLTSLPGYPRLVDALRASAAGGQLIDDQVQIDFSATAGQLNDALFGTSGAHGRSRPASPETNCPNSNFFSPFLPTTGSNLAGYEDEALPDLCFTPLKPADISATDATFGYEQLGQRFTFLLDPKDDTLSPTSLRGIVTNRRVGTSSLSDLATKFISNELESLAHNTKASVGWASHCTSSLASSIWHHSLSKLDCGTKKLSQQIDGVLSPLAKAMVGEPIRGDVTVNNSPTGANLVVVGWGRPSRVGIDGGSGTGQWNLLSMVLSMIDLFVRPIIAMTLGSSGGGGGIDDCFDLQKITDSVLKSPTVRSQIIHTVLEENTSLDSLARGDADGAYKALDLGSLIEAISGTVTSCPKEQLQHLLTSEIKGLLSSAVTSISSHLADIAESLGGAMKILNVAWNIGELQGKFNALTPEINTPDCVRLWVSTNPSAGTSAGFPTLCSGQSLDESTGTMPSPAAPSSDLVTREQLMAAVPSDGSFGSSLQLNHDETDPAPEATTEFLKGSPACEAFLGSVSHPVTRTNFVSGAGILSGEDDGSQIGFTVDRWVDGSTADAASELTTTRAALPSCDTTYAVTPIGGDTTVTFDSNIAQQPGGPFGDESVLYEEVAYNRTNSQYYRNFDVLIRDRNAISSISILGDPTSSLSLAQFLTFVAIAEAQLKAIIG
jgi:hypothetical protein